MLTDEKLKEWQEAARRDDACTFFVASDIRVMLGEIARLRAALQPFASAYEAVERETKRLTAVNPNIDWQFASTGYRGALGENIAPTWFRDAAAAPQPQK